MKALVISGGGSKGAFGGGVAQYLIEEEHKDYDILVGTSTGSLMLTHLALNRVQAIKDIYTNICAKDIFSLNPFIFKKHKGYTTFGINHFNLILSFLKSAKTFGRSENLRRLIKEKITREMFDTLKASKKEVVVTVSNVTLNEVEYKRLKDCTYEDYCDWIWASSNYAPFMSILEKNNFEYADGGFGTLVPIKQAIDLGATEIDVIILDTEINQFNRMGSRNPFEMLTYLFGFMLEQGGLQDVVIGKLEAKNHNACLNLYYTPTILTTNSLVFEKKKMEKWWKQGFKYAESQNANSSNELKSKGY